MARKFFYVCAGLFALALALQSGVKTAAAQLNGNQVVAASGENNVMTANGDWYEWSGGWIRNNNVFELSGHPLGVGDEIVSFQGGRVFTRNGDFFTWNGTWVYGGNILGGATTPSARSTWGSVKVGNR